MTQPNYPIHHQGGAQDKRYTVTKEFAGQDKPVFVARFCGEFIGSSRSYSAVVILCVGHKSALLGSPVITEQRKERE